MAKYTGKTINVERPAADIADKFADLSKLQVLLDSLPEEERQKLGNVAFTTDSIEIDTHQVGKINLCVTERTPSKVKFEAQGSPMPLEMVVDLKPTSDTSTDMSASIEIQIPMMLKPLVGPHLQKAVDMLTGVIVKVAEK